MVSVNSAASVGMKRMVRSIMTAIRSPRPSRRSATPRSPGAIANATGKLTAAMHAKRRIWLAMRLIPSALISAPNGGIVTSTCVSTSAKLPVRPPLISVLKSEKTKMTTSRYAHWKRTALHGMPAVR